MLVATTVVEVATPPTLPAVAPVATETAATTPPPSISVDHSPVFPESATVTTPAQREGIFREMKLRGHFEKPSEKKAREKAEAIRRARKLQRKKLQREGLLPMPKKVERPERPMARG